MKYGVFVSDLSIDEAGDLLTLLRTREYEADQFGEDDSQPAQTLTAIPNTNVTGNSLEVDSAGMPWDARIHAQNKAKKADGTWKSGRGVDPELLKQVEAEIRPVQTTGFITTASPIPTPTAPIVDATMPVAAINAPQAVVNTGGIILPPTTNPVEVSAPPVNNYLPPVTAAEALPLSQPQATPFTEPVAQPVVAPTAAPVVLVQTPPARDFDGLMKVISHLYATAKLTDPMYSQTHIVDRINSSYQLPAENKVTTITDIINNPTYVEFAWKCLEVDKHI